MGMSLEQMRELANSGVKQRRKQHDEEHQIQVACVRWFRLQYSKLSLNLFAVPNGGRRDKVTAGKLKAEGVVAGVADLLLLVPSGCFHGLAIEMKTRIGRRRDSQKEWQEYIQKQGYKYVVCRSLDDFMSEVQHYLPTCK